MPEKRTQTRMFRFDQMAVQVKDKIDNPAEADVDRYVGLEHIDPGSLKIRRWGKTTDVESSKIIFKAGDIIFGKRRAYQRKLAVADFDGICSAHAMVLRPKTDVVLREFLPFFMQSDIFMDRAVKISVGGLSPTINWNDLAKEAFALPPLEEQRRIAEVLQAAESCRNRFVYIESTLRDVQNSTLTRAFPTNLSGNSDYPTLDSLCSIIGDGTHLPPPFTKAGIPFLLVSNITNGEIDWNTEKFVSEKSYEMLTKTWRPQQGDLLYSLVGSFGVPARVETEKRFTFQRHIGLIRTNPDLLLADYLYWYLRSPGGYRQATWRAEGLAQKTITLGALRAFHIPWRPVHEQQEFIKQFETIEAQRIELVKRETAVGQLTMSIINTQLGEGIQ